jgi:hypothetical protein
MIVEAERSGGIGGWHEQLGPVDTAEAPAGKEIEQAVTESDFFNLPAKYPAKQTVYDGYRYTLTVRNDDDASHAVGWETGSEVPAGLSRILASLDAAADWERIS